MNVNELFERAKLVAPMRNTVCVVITAEENAKLFSDPAWSYIKTPRTQPDGIDPKQGAFVGFFERGTKKVIVLLEHPTKVRRP
jgi:hypothetical protein